MQQIDLWLETVHGMVGQAGAFLPKLVLALVVLLAGWLIGRLVRLIVRKSLRSINFHVLTQRAGIDGFLERGGVPFDTTAILAALTYWLVILGSLLIAFNSLGLTYATDLLGRVVMYMPKAFFAVLILAFGAYLARFVGEATTAYCRAVEARDADLLGKVAKTVVLVFVVLIALDHLDIGGNVLRESFLILLGGVVLALALAFGIGGQRWAANLIEHWWSRGK